jgi:hypothetical protein
MAAAPTSLSYTINGLGKAVIAWARTIGAVSYNIYKRSDAIGSLGNPLNISPIQAFTYTDLAFVGTIENYYVVTSVDALGAESLPSDTLYIPYQSGSAYVMPRVDLWAPAFDKFVTERGYNVIWEKAISCPCNTSTKSTTDATDLNCPLCHNKHFIWVSPTPIKAMMTSLGRNFNLEEDGIYQVGTYKVTTHSEYKIGFYDRLTFTESTAPFSQTIVKGALGGTDVLRFPAITVNLPIIDINGIQYTNGPDFQITATGDIQWVGTTQPQREPAVGASYGIAYNTQWRMLSTEYAHDIRDTHVQLGTGSPVFVKMARQCLCRLEFFFDQ